MSIRVTCPQCQTTVSVREEAAGKSVRCKVCQGSLRVPAALEDIEEEYGRPEQARKTSKTKSRSAKSGTPHGVVLAMSCVGVLMLLNLWELASDDGIVWKFIAVLRLFVEARVLWGMKERQDQTALTATVAAGMMTLVSFYMLYIVFTDLELQVEMTSAERVASKVYFLVQTFAEIGVIVGINLPESKVFLSKRST